MNGIKFRYLPIMHERINYEIYAHGLNQKIVAERIGVNRKTVGGWCNGYYIPNAIDLMRLCALLNVSADYIVCLSNTKQIKKGE